jgi:microcompartment protein CcmK/EutM
VTTADDGDPAPSQPDDELLAERYGRRRPGSRRRALVLAVVGVLVLVALTAGMFAWQRSKPQASAQVVAYKVLSDDQVLVIVHVAKPEGRAVACRVVAQDRTGGVVGSADVAFPAPGTSAQHTTTLRTRGKAVVAVVDSCTMQGG